MSGASQPRLIVGGPEAARRARAAHHDTSQQRIHTANRIFWYPAERRCAAEGGSSEALLQGLFSGYDARTGGRAQSRTGWAEAAPHAQA